MDYRGINVTIDCEMLEECVQTMRSLKSEIKTMKESNTRGVGIETLDHCDEEVEDEENDSDIEEEEDPRGKWLKVLFEMKGRYKMEVSTYTCSLNREELISWVREMEKYFDMRIYKTPKG